MSNEAQRQIKFRAWDEYNKRFVEKDQPHIKPHIDQTFEVWEILSCNDRCPIILMQFTGLLDKNGKEIYEGDIVKENDGNFEVKWGNDTHPEYWGWLLYDAEGFTEEFYGRGPDNGEGEVIGNIYENPELMKS